MVKLKFHFIFLSGQAVDFIFGFLKEFERSEILFDDATKFLALYPVD